MSKGAFIVHADAGGIIFANAGTHEVIPEDQANLVQIVSDFETTLKVLFPNKPEKYEIYFDRLLSTAQGGLVGDNPLTEMAIAAVEQMKSELASREGRGIKTKYLVELGWMSALSAVVAMILYFALGCAFPDLCSSDWSEIRHYLIVWSGSMIGLWVSYAVRRTEVNFEELSIMDKRTTEAAIRVIFVGLVSAAFALFLSTGVMEFAIGDFKFHQFKLSIETAGLLGLIAGFSEQTLPTKLMDVGKKGMAGV